MYIHVCDSVELIIELRVNGENGAVNERTSFTLEGISAICCDVTCVCVSKTKNTVRVLFCSESKQRYKLYKQSTWWQKGSV